MVAHTECACRKIFLPSHKRKLYAKCATETTPQKSHFTNTTLRQCLRSMCETHTDEDMATHVVPYDRHSHLLE